MKLFGGIASIFIIAIVIGIMVVQVQKRETDVTLKKTVVAMVMNGSRDDHSWAESHFIAMEKVAESLNLEVLYYENVKEDSTCTLLLEEIAGKGAKIVIANSFGFGPYVAASAEKHPEIKYFHATGVKNGTNLSNYFGRIYQMRYLSGLVAGAMTKTGEVGYVAAFDIPEVNRGINAFALGVQKANPGAKVYVGWSHSWVSDSLAADAIKRLKEKHDIDVMTVHTDALAAYEYAEQNDIWIVGYNVDNSKRYPKKFLTAPVWRWEKFYEPRILEVLQDKFVGKSYWLGVESGMMDLAPISAVVPDEVKDLVASEMNRLRDGSFDVFYGPIYDNTNQVRVDYGESMTDLDMLNHFDWYVKGVVNE